MFSEKELDNILESLFNLKRIKIEWENIFISQKCNKEITYILSLIDKNWNTTSDKINYIKKLQWKKKKSDCINKSLDSLLEVYSKKI